MKHDWRALADGHTDVPSAMINILAIYQGQDTPPRADLMGKQLKCTSSATFTSLKILYQSFPVCEAIRTRMWFSKRFFSLLVIRTKPCVGIVFGILEHVPPVAPHLYIKVATLPMLSLDQLPQIKPQSFVLYSQLKPKNTADEMLDESKFAESIETGFSLLFPVEGSSTLMSAITANAFCIHAHDSLC